MEIIPEFKRRFGKHILFNIRPWRDRNNDEIGECCVCGSESGFVFNSWVIPPEQFSDRDRAVGLAYTRRESMFCRSCCSSLRVRGLAAVLLRIYGNDALNFAELMNQSEFRLLDVAEINAIGSMGSLHSFLQRLPRLNYSEYRGPNRLGEIIDGRRNEDIGQLTYEDESFDLVLTSDTLEHVSDFGLALRETRRILRPGGRHIFTVPVVTSIDRTYARSEMRDGKIVHLLPPIYHGRGGGLYRFIPTGDDFLAFTEFGRDLPDYIRDAGFEPEVLRGFDDGDETGAELVFSGRVPD